MVYIRPINLVSEEIEIKNLMSKPTSQLPVCSVQPPIISNLGLHRVNMIPLRSHAVSPTKGRPRRGVDHGFWILADKGKVGSRITQM